MSEQIYTENPELYDAIQSEWDYDRDVQFVCEAVERHGIAGDRMLEVGCGTGEHTLRFLDRGFNVTAVDRYDGMLDVAREKCDADIRPMTLPAVTVQESFDLIVALRGVVNHLDSEDLETALARLVSRLDDGILVFDNAPLPAEGNEPALDVGTAPRGRYARVVQMCPTGGDRLQWNSVVFLEDGDCFRNSRTVTPFNDETIRDTLTSLTLTVDTHDGFGPTDDRTVFVAKTDSTT